MTTTVTIIIVKEKENKPDFNKYDVDYVGNNDDNYKCENEGDDDSDDTMRTMPEMRRRMSTDEDEDVDVPRCPGSVFQLKPSYVAVVLFAGKAWDAVTDPTCGFLVQRTRTRWGQLRPWSVLTSRAVSRVMGAAC